MSAAGHARPLLAARLSSGEASKDGGGNTSPGSNRPPAQRPKRTLIESACSACRRRKSRCDGLRPACSRCQNLRTDCHYEAEEGESRWSALRRRNQILEQERDSLRELFAFVQTRPEAEAQELFQRIRSTAYEDVFTLLRQIRDGVLGLHPHMAQMPSPVPPGPEQRLPPIQTILDVPSHPAHPNHHVVSHPHLTHSHSLSSEDSRASSIPDLTPSMTSSGPPIHPALHPMEPSMHLSHPHPHPPPHHTPPMLGIKPALSSEESTGSMSSTSMDQNKPYPP